MQLPYFSEEFLGAVRAMGERDYARLYQSGDPWVRSLSGAASGIRESQIQVQIIPAITCEPDARTEADAANAIALFESFKKLTPVQASDERLWAYLSHTTYWDYMRIRWGAEEDNWDKIERRWFFKGSSMERLARNGIARLWWGAYATNQPDSADPYRLTRILFSNTDIQFHYMERLFGKNRRILHTLLDFTQSNVSRIRPRQSVGKWAADTGKLINRVGGVLQLDALNQSEIEELLEAALRDLYSQQKS